MIRRTLLVVGLVGLGSCLKFQERIDECFTSGPCSLSPDGGGIDQPFVPLLDAGFRFRSEWRWESPLPFGHDLNAVYASGDQLLVVAGTDGFLAERRGTEWVSIELSSAWNAVNVPPSFLHLVARDEGELWLTDNAGGLWHRDAGSWETVPTGGEAAYSLAVFDREVFLGTADGRAGRLGVAGLLDAGSFGAGSVELGVYANEVVVLVADDGGQRLTDLNHAPFFLQDGGKAVGLDVERLAASSNDLWLTGEVPLRARDGGRVLEPFSEGMSAVSPGSPGAVAALNSGVSNVDGQMPLPFTPRGVTHIRSFSRDEDAIPNVVWAVGEAGQIYSAAQPGTIMVPHSSAATFGDLRAIVPFGETLLAFTDDGEVLQRQPSGWRLKGDSVELGSTSFVDAVVDGPRVIALDVTHTLFFFASADLRPTTERLAVADVDGGQHELGVLTAEHLWRTTSGALVVSGANGLFMRKAEEKLFTQVYPFASHGLGGRAETVRACTTEGVVELDLSAELPAVTLRENGARYRDCTTVLAVEDGWVYGTAASGAAKVIHKWGNNTEDEATIATTTQPVSALLDLGTDVAVGMDGFVILPYLNMPVSPNPFDTRIGNRLFCFTKWRGHLFAGGENGAILERELK